MTPISQDPMLYFWFICSVVFSFFSIRGIYQAIKDKDKEVLQTSILFLAASLGPSAIILGGFAIIYGISWLLNEGLPSAIFWLFNLKEDE